MADTRDYAALPIASRGIATIYPDSDTPPEYCDKLENLYINATNQIEKRQGLQAFSVVPTNATISNLHELVSPTGTVILFASAAGKIWKYDGTNWTNVFSFLNTTKTIQSSVIKGSIIFFNGVDRNVYTMDGTTFLEHRSLLDVGRAGSIGSLQTSARGLVDPTIANWTTRNVSQYDLVYYTSLSAYGLITAVGSAVLTHTAVSAEAIGLGLSLVGEPVSGRPYQIIDTVALNIVSLSGQTDKNNLTSLSSPSSASRVYARNVADFTATEIRKGDYIYNATRDAVTDVLDISTSSLVVTPVTGQGVNDEIRFLKSSVPIASKGHVHYRRLYLVDSRDEQRVRISGPNNPFNFGNAGAGTFDLGAQQSKGERIVQMRSFQRFMIFGGTRNIYIYEGIVPIGTTEENAADFSLEGSFPTGLFGEISLEAIGNDLLFLSRQGIVSSTLRKTTGQLEKVLASHQFNPSLLGLLKFASSEEVFVIDYPRRSWLLFRVGSTIYCYNYTNTVSGEGRLEDKGSNMISWSTFTGPFAAQRCYFVRENGDLLTGNTQGTVNIFDQGAYSELTNPIPTIYRTGWTQLYHGSPQGRVVVKEGKALRPYIQLGNTLPITISVEAPFDGRSKDSVTVTASTSAAIVGIAVVGSATIGGSPVYQQKLPLRWNGEYARFRFETNSIKGPITLGESVIYHKLTGVE